MKIPRRIEQIVTYGPPAGIVISASILNLSALQHQILMLILIIWANAFFLFKSWLAN